jgi:gp16 family phage-associated protein
MLRYDLTNRNINKKMMIPLNPAPSSQEPLKTGEQARADLKARGMNITQWCKQHNLSRAIVYAVLEGRHKGFRGQAHDAAVLLGMKHGVVGGNANLVNPVQAGAADGRARPKN